MGRPKKMLKDIGLPSNWKEIIYGMSAMGCSEVEIRAHFLMLGGQFSQKTWDAIKEREKEFLLTIQKSKILCQAWWEAQSRKSLRNPNFQTGSWYANMKNRFGWRDKTEIDHGLQDSLLDKFKDWTPDEIRAEQARVASTILGTKGTGETKKTS